MASATRLGCAPIRSNTRPSAEATAFGSVMLTAFSDGTTAPGGSASIACAVTDSDESREATVAADTRWRAISTATVGGAGDRSDLLNKGDLVDLAKRRDALQHLLDGRLAQESHAFFVCELLDFG